MSALAGFAHVPGRAGWERGLAVAAGKQRAAAVEARVALADLRTILRGERGMVAVGANGRYAALVGVGACDVALALAVVLPLAARDGRREYIKNIYE